MDSVDEIFGMGVTDVGVAEAEASVQEPASGDAGTIERGDVETTTPMVSLANFVMDRFREAHDRRMQSGVTERLDYCLSAQKCVFSDRQRDILAKKFPREVVDSIFSPITSVKNRAARSMLIDLVNQSGEPLFRLEPTPDPELPQDVSVNIAKDVFMEVVNLVAGLEKSGVGELPPEADEKIRELVEGAVDTRHDDIVNKADEIARDRAKRLQRKVWDIMCEGGFNEAFEEYIDYICTFGTGVIVGPVERTIAKNECRTDANGVVKYRRTFRKVPVFEAVNPLDCYPAPDAKDACDGAFCITVKYTADELWRFARDSRRADRNGGGWMKDTVRGILARNPRGGVKLNIATFDRTRMVCENNGFESTEDCTFEGVRCFASVRGSELLEMGISQTPDRRKVEAADFYKVETIVVDNFVVYCRIFPDEMEFPISKGVFYTLPGSWWGEAIADKVKACQCILNNCISSLLQNMSASSGSIFWISDVQRMMNKSPDALRLKAGQTVAFSSANALGGNAGTPIGALNIPSTAGELMNVFQRINTQADYDSGLPAYTEGQSAGSSGALRTAQGLAMFTEASSRGLKMVMTTTDRQVISRCARLVADWVLLNDGDTSAKGDVSVRSVGLIGKILKAQRDQSRMQLFQMCLNSPLLQQALGVKGIMEMFRPALDDIDMNPDDIMPSKGRMEQLEAIETIRAVTQASSGAAPQQEAAPAGGVPGVQTPEVPKPVEGGVAQRRSAA